jgi:hypothetical protein
MSTKIIIATRNVMTSMLMNWSICFMSRVWVARSNAMPPKAIASLKRQNMRVLITTSMNIVPATVCVKLLRMVQRRAAIIDTDAM